MMPGFYNHNYQILQIPGYVVIYVEMIHDARIIPLDGRPHPDAQIRQWLGDSRGHWEGDTLVVETTNFIPVSGRALTVFGANETTHLEERFTRTGVDSVDYQYTVTDPDRVLETVDGLDSDDGSRRAAVRVRLPRRQLRTGEHPGRRARPGGSPGRGRQPLAGKDAVRRV